MSINIFVKTGLKMGRDQGRVKHFDLFGKRDSKYDYLENHALEGVTWNALQSAAPNYYFTNKDYIGWDAYEKGF